MAQIFHRSTNCIARFSVSSTLFLVGVALVAVLAVARSPYMTRQNVTREQPVQFSHKHHVGDDGIDCRYCHTGVETSAVAGIPPTKTCMNCHSVLFNTAAYLEPIRESYRSDKSIEWVKVHRLADFVYFNHSIHVNKCVGCQRNPEQVLRPKDQVFNMDWKAPDNQAEIGAKLREEYKIRTTAELTSCSTCHR